MIDVALGVGLLAAIVQSILLAAPHNRNLLLFMSGVMFLWAAHYWLLGSSVAAGLHVWGAVTMWVGISAQGQTQKQKALKAGAITATNIAIVLVLYSQLADAVMGAGNTIFGLCHILLSGKRLRYGYIVGEAAVGVSAFMLGSIPGVVMAVAMIALNFIAIRRWALGRGALGAA